MLSTNTNPEDGIVQRRVDREVLAVPCPNSVINYNAHMGGVDLADQKRSYYGVGRESVKFWRYLVWYILNTAIINSYIIYTQSLARPLTHEQHTMTHLKYRLKIVKQLIAGFSSRKRAGRRVMTAPGHTTVTPEWTWPGKEAGMSQLQPAEAKDGTRSECRYDVDV